MHRPPWYTYISTPPILYIRILYYVYACITCIYVYIDAPPHLSRVTVLLSRVSLCVSGALLKKKLLSSRHRIRTPWRGMRGRGDFFLVIWCTRSLRIVVAVALCVYYIDLLTSTAYFRQPLPSTPLVFVCSGVVISSRLHHRRWHFACVLSPDIDTFAVAQGWSSFVLTVQRYTAWAEGYDGDDDDYISQRRRQVYHSRENEWERGRERERETVKRECQRETEREREREWKSKVR